jgi:hypothetical protein
MKNPNDIVTRITEYTDVIITEFGYNSLSFASFEYDRIGTTYSGSMVSPITHLNGKYWIIIETPKWFVKEH